MFQPLPVSLDHALKVGAAQLRDVGMGTLQKAELLPGGHIPQPVLQGGRAAAEDWDSSWKILVPLLHQKVVHRGRESAAQPRVPGPLGGHECSRG